MNTAARQINDPSARKHARLAALAEYDILDSAAEPEFDAIARLAAQICDTRFAFIALIDERRLWIRGSHAQAGTRVHVEGDESIRTITRIALETLGGLALLSCADGQSAIAEAAAFQPGLLLIDVMMPGLDGPATLKGLSGVLSVDQIPVVFMTAKNEPDDHLSHYALGVSAVIVKPFDPMTLATQIQAIWHSFHE